MTNSIVDHLIAPARDGALTWNRATFDDLRDILGDEKVNGILSRFWLDLCERFADNDDGEGLRRDAHIVKTSAGLLGFESLGEAAQSLETACNESRPFKALAEAIDARRREVGKILCEKVPKLTPFGVHP